MRKGKTARDRSSGALDRALANKSTARAYNKVMSEESSHHKVIAAPAHFNGKRQR